MSDNDEETEVNPSYELKPHQHNPDQEHKTQTVTYVLMAVVSVLTIVVLAMAVKLWSHDDVSLADKKDAGSVATQRLITDNPDCPDFTVKLEPRSVGDHDVIPGGVPTNLTPEEKKEFIAQHAKWDPSVFKSFFNDSPLVTKGIEPAITDPKGLTTAWKNGACWTEKGQNLYNEWALYWKNVSAKSIPLPAWGTNTGSTGSDIFSVNGAAIPAGTATEFTYHDATHGKPIGSSKMRDQCGNIVREGSAPIPGIPSIPPGTTPPPVTTPPPTETTPPPTTTTPPTETTPPPTTTTTPPPTTTTLVPKDPSVDPYPQGNAPEGGGPNDQSGPGPSNIPTQPPSTPRTNPPRPVATAIPGTPAPTRVSTPVVAPPPEPGVNGDGTGTTAVPHTDPTGGVTTSVVITTAVPKPQ